MVSRVSKVPVVILHFGSDTPCFGKIKTQINVLHCKVHFYVFFSVYIIKQDITVGRKTGLFERIKFYLLEGPQDPGTEEVRGTKVMKNVSLVQTLDASGLTKV